MVCGYKCITKKLPAFVHIQKPIVDTPANKKPREKVGLRANKNPNNVTKIQPEYVKNVQLPNTDSCNKKCNATSDNTSVDNVIHKAKRFEKTVGASNAKADNGVTSGT